MLKYFLFSFTIILFNCSFQESNKTESNNTIVEYTDTIQSTTTYHVEPSTLDSFKITKYKEYAKDWNASYFPLPTPAMLKHSPIEDPGYVYLSNSFDSLSYKNSTVTESSIGQPCSWKQKFKSGITYTKSTCMAGGTKYSILTSSKDKQTLIRLIDMLFYTSVNDWNKDSTQYAPLSEKTGCYYLLEKNDIGNYNILYSSSY